MFENSERLPIVNLLLSKFAEPKYFVQFMQDNYLIHDHIYYLCSKTYTQKTEITLNTATTGILFNGKQISY